MVQGLLAARCADDGTEFDGSSGRWRLLAERILAGHRLTADEGLAVLEAPDDELLELLAAAYLVRRHYFGNRVQLYFLCNAKSGLCPEDCGYCSQSRDSSAEIPKYRLLSAEELLAGAEAAAQRQAKTYCIVLSGRGPSERELAALCAAVPLIKSRLPLKICVCLGLLTEDQAQKLKDAGVDRVNHNLNTSERFYEEICSTHDYADRQATLRAVRRAGLEVCSGGIVGMGETHADVVAMALALREHQAHSIPVNFYHPIAGTRLAGPTPLDPRYCLKVLALFRFAHPDREVRIAGGREWHLRALQPLGLFAANSLFVGDYLTTQGQAAHEDFQMIADLGFAIERHSPSE